MMVCFVFVFDALQCFMFMRLLSLQLSYTVAFEEAKAVCAQYCQARSPLSVHILVKGRGSPDEVGWYLAASWGKAECMHASMACLLLREGVLLHEEHAVAWKLRVGSA
jgi:hypothetical protein